MGLGDPKDEVSLGAKEKVEDKDVRRESTFGNMPMIVIVLICLALVFLFFKAQSAGADGWKQVAPWIALIVAIVIFFGMKAKRYGVLKEEEVKYLLTKKLAEKKRTGEIPRNVQAYVNLESDLKYIDGGARYYIAGITLIQPDDLRPVYKRAKIDAYTGNITIQDAKGRVTGNEGVEVINMLPKIMKDANRMGLLKEMLKGGGPR